jgi:hypothetical protein
LRQHARATKAESEILQRAWGMDVRHIGGGRGPVSLRQGEPNVDSA